jgi:hypothetical protein
MPLGGGNERTSGQDGGVSGTHWLIEGSVMPLRGSALFTIRTS